MEITHEKLTVDNGRALIPAIDKLIILIGGIKFIRMVLASMPILLPILIFLLVPIASRTFANPQRLNRLLPTLEKPILHGPRPGEVLSLKRRFIKM